MNKRLPEWTTFLFAPAAIGLAFAILKVMKTGTLGTFAGVFSAAFVIMGGLSTFLTDIRRLYAGLAFAGAAAANGVVWFMLVNQGDSLSRGVGTLIAAIAFGGALVGGLSGVIGGRKAQENLGQARALLQQR